MRRKKAPRRLASASLCQGVDYFIPLIISLSLGARRNLPYISSSWNSKTESFCCELLSRQRVPLIEALPVYTIYSIFYAA